MKESEIREVKLINYEIKETFNTLAYTTPYGISMLNAPNMWANGCTGKGIKIAVIDTGCDITHPNLKDRIIGGRNFTTDDNGNPNIFTDYQGHGTHVAGTIAATKGSNGVVGVAPEASLLILKALDRKGQGQIKWIIDAINYAVSQKVNIISMSLGGSQDNEQLHQAVANAVNNNILVVCAAGNEGDNANPITDEISYPGAYSESIEVGAIDQNKNPAVFTNSNKQVDLVAPGVGILSTYKGGRYATLSGTSMSAPHVAGALALLINWATKEFGRDLTESEIYAQLIKNTIPLSIARTLQGNGMLYLAPTIITK